MLVERFTDFNKDGAVNNHDLTLEAFPLTDGNQLVIGGVTNLHVPGDLNTTAGAITVKLEIATLGFGQRPVGSHIYRLTSPTSRFAAVTAPFTITNAPWASELRGKTTSAGTNVPFALVIIFAMGNDADFYPKVTGLSDSTGSYSLKLPPGTYMPAAFGTNFMMNFAGEPITIGPGETATNNIVMARATRRITGRVQDYVNTSKGLGGMLVIAENKTIANIAAGFSDQNGNINIGVGPTTWDLRPDESSVGFLGYVAPQSGVPADCTSADVTGLVLPVAPANALIYGTVKTDGNVPMVGVGLSGDANEQGLRSDAVTDQFGRYFCSMRNGTWSLWVNRDQGLYPNTVFSELTNWRETMSADQALQRNFTGIAAPRTISGTLKDNLNTPLERVQVNATIFIGQVRYTAAAYTGSDGSYILPVFNGTWDVNAACDGEDGVRQRGYGCPASIATTVNNNNPVVNLVVSSCNGLNITSLVLPNGMKDQWYQHQLTADTCGGVSWVLGFGPLPPGIQLDGAGLISGTPTQTGTWNFQVQAIDGQNWDSQQLSITIDTAQPLDITTYGVDTATNGIYYTETLQAAGGQPPYTWSLAPGSGPLPLGLTLVNGVISGTPNQAGDIFFRIQVTDALNATLEKLFKLIVRPATEPLVITTASLPNGTVGTAYSTFLVGTGGQEPRWWNMGLGSGPLPPGLALNATYGEIAGTPTTPGTNTFIIQLSDSLGGGVEKVFSIVINSSSTGPLTITTTSLPNATVGSPYSAFLAGSGGQAPRWWDMAAGSGPLPAGLMLNNTFGEIVGTPTTAGTNTFIVKLFDSANGAVQKVLSIGVNPRPPVTLSNTTIGSNGKLQFTITGSMGASYTIQASTDLATWGDVITTNAPGQSFTIEPPNTTAPRIFYRVRAN